MSNYSAIVAVRGTRQPLDTSMLFDDSFNEGKLSPVDLFLENSVALNRQWTTLPQNEEVAPEVGRLLLVGYASAVEGYMRSLIRRLVHIDPYTANICAPLQLSYAAAIHHPRETLPDALLEEVSFSSQNQIGPSLKKFAGVEKLSAGTALLLTEFDQILHLRHCCTHRFGKLGAKNATALGLERHSALLEKPVRLSKASLESIADLTFNMVKSVNNDVFGAVMDRAATQKLPHNTAPGLGWTWHKARDRKSFKRYYDLFCSTKDANPSPSLDEVYELYREQYRNVGRQRQDRR